MSKYHPPTHGWISGRIIPTTLTALVISASLVGCSGNNENASSDGSASSELTMWVRSSTDAYSQRLVDTYNETHDAQVNLTVIPDDNYQQKVGAAAGSGSLPDILAADVVYAPNYVNQGIYSDITTEVKELNFYDSLVAASLNAASVENSIYAVPHKVDSSLIIYNKDLYKKAGLDPENPPSNYEEIYEDAKAIRELGGDTYGFYFGGNCAGCMAYTSFPYAVASGYKPFSDDGTLANFDNEGFSSSFKLYKRLFDEGITPKTAQTENGTTWASQFEAGNIGIIPLGTYEFAALKENDRFDWGVAPLTSENGDNIATFIGGDVIGVSSTSAKREAALDFVLWTLNDDAQVKVVAKNGDLPVRLDLADNEYSASDERIVAAIGWMQYGYTPATLSYGETVNNTMSPWLVGARGAIFGDNPTQSLTSMQEEIQSAIDH